MAIEGITSHYNENVTKYRVLSEQECEKIIENALRIIGEIGMEVDDEASLKLLAEGGCEVEGTRVRLPREVVFKAIESAPSHIDVFDRNGNKVMDIGGTNVYFGTGPTNPNVNDFETKERRSALVEDTERSSRVCDALPNIDFVMNLADASDCPPEINDVYAMRAMLMNTTKPLMVLARNATTLDEQMQMATAVVGGWENYREKPFVMCLCGDPVSPLYMETDAIQKLEYCARQRIPVTCPSGVLLGSTGPVTIPAAFSLSFAENLFCLVVTQIVNPGSPFMFCIGVTTTDMKTTKPCYATPEHVLAENMGGDICRYLNLPVMGTGCMSDSSVLDEQVAIEATFFVLAEMLDGGHIVHDVGFLDSALTTDLDAVVMIDEIISYARRIQQGVTFDEEELGFDAIAEVGPKGEFVTSEHTLDNFGHVWYPTLIDRNVHGKWFENGAKDMRTRVHEKTQGILESHTVEALPGDVQAKIDEVLEAANARVAE